MRKRPPKKKTKRARKKPSPKRKHMPTVPVLLSYINQSTKLTDAQVAASIPAFGRQLAQDYAPVHGAAPGVEFVPKGGKVNGNAFAYVVDKVPEAPGALAYHDVDRDGSITGVKGAMYMKIAVDTPGYDWRTSASHENLEAAKNAAANGWKDNADGTKSVSDEVCDPVQAQTYIDPVDQETPLSNFVYPAWFNPFAGPDDRMDHLEKLSAPQSMAKDGYTIWRVESGNVSDVYADHVAQGHEVHVVLAAHETAHGHAILVIFGAEYPEERKLATLTKVQIKHRKAAA